MILSHSSRGFVHTVGRTLTARVLGRQQWWFGDGSRLMVASSGAQNCWYPALNLTSGFDTYLSCCVTRSSVCIHIHLSRNMPHSGCSVTLTGATTCPPSPHCTSAAWISLPSDSSHEPSSRAVYCLRICVLRSWLAGWSCVGAAPVSLRRPSHASQVQALM